MSNPHLTDEYKKKHKQELKQESREIQLKLPNHRFTQWQQEAYDAIMSGKPFIWHTGRACGKTYLANAIRNDIESLDKLLKELNE